MTRRKMQIALRIGTITVLAGAVVQIVNLQAQIAHKKDELRMLDRRVEEYRTSNQALQQELQNGISDTDISEIARAELGYAVPGERIFVDTSSK